jgi:8-oxo-dGTP pyrophosphatase MutT (NUDIX family)
MNVGNYKIDVRGKLYNLKLLGNSKMPDFDKVSSASALIFDKDGLILGVRLKNRGLDIPGGHTEPGDLNPEETLRREVMEEASATIKDIKLLEVIESDFFGSTPEKASYMLIYTASIDQILPYDDADEMAYERIFLSKDHFLSQYTAGDPELMKSLVDKAHSDLS